VPNRIFQRFFKVLPILYPVFIYLGLNYFSPGIVGLGIAGLIGIRLFIQKSLPKSINLKFLSPIFFLIIFILIINLFLNQEILIKLYTVFVNLGLLMLFVYSLFRPPNIAERIARLTHPDLNPEEVRYTRKVTIGWAIFFIFNTVISLYTVFYCSLETWTLYNGFIAYVLVGILFSVEYGIRLWFIERHRTL